MSCLYPCAWNPDTDDECKPAMIGFTGSEGIFLTTYNATNPDFETALEYSYEYFWCPATKTTM